MARYFFDVRSGATEVVNGQGIDADDLDIAVKEAALALGDLADEMANGTLAREMSVDIRDGHGRVVATVKLVLEIP